MRLIKILCSNLFIITCLILIQGIKNSKDSHLSKNNEFSYLPAGKYVSLSKDMIFMIENKTKTIDVIIENGTEEERGANTFAVNHFDKM